jgi:hypothetical protein
MNAKKAKGLRRTALDMSKGKPMVEVVPTSGCWVGIPGGSLAWWDGQRKLMKRCTRTLYKMLKRKQSELDRQGLKNFKMALIRNAGL